MPVFLHLLGAPRVEVDGAPAAFDTRKATALLAYLGVTARPQRRETLAALLWPDYDDERARGALRRTLSTVRSAVGEALSADGQTISLLGVDVDVTTFRRLAGGCRSHAPHPDAACASCAGELEEAAAAYGGELLAGFSLRDSPDFEDWQLAEADSLRRELAAALELLVDALARSGRPGDAAAHARRWLALDPLHEPAHRSLMRLYARSGDRAAALRQYRDCVAVLDRELGVPPLDETVALYDAIRADTLERPAPAPSPASRVRVLPLVGREGEVQLLSDAYAGATAGRLVVVEGEQGIGKTRLMSELVLLASAAPVATVRCYEDEMGLAYAPVTGALRVLGERLGAASPAAREEAARLLTGSGEDAVSRARLLDGVASALLAALSSGAAPGLLVVDDAHWADDASLDVLAYLMHRIAGHNVCAALTWRSELVGEGHRLRRVVADARRDGIVTVVAPGRLEPSHVAILAEGGAADPERLWRETEGLPFFVAEYLAAIEERGAAAWDLPGGVRDVLAARVASASEAARQVLSAASVIGRSFEFEHVREAGGRSDEETVGALEELERRGIVTRSRADPGSYDFAHERLRSFVYESTSLARRRLLHRRTAAALIRRTRRRPGPLAATVARHLESAGRDSDAAKYHAAAAQHASALFANAEALGHLEAALALGGEPAPLREAAGDVRTLLGRYGEALVDYEAAVALGESARRSTLEHKLGTLRLRLGDLDAAASHLAAALDLAGDDAARARIEADLSLVAHRSGGRDEAQVSASRALSLAESAGDVLARAQAHNILGILSTHGGRRQDAVAHLEASLSLAGDLRDPSATIASLNNLSLATDDPERALHLATRALELCRRQGDRHREAALHNRLADLHHASGRRDEEMAHQKQAMAIFAEVGETDTLRPEIWKLVEW